MRLSSPAFENGAMIPRTYTCDGADTNPPLIAEEIPEGTKSLALIVEDPDAPGGNFVHWVVYDIPVSSSVKRIDANSVPGKLGVNDSGKAKYKGPCPLSGIHRYFFRLFALDVMFDLEEGATSAQALREEEQGHVIEKTELMGLYSR